MSVFLADVINKELAVAIGFLVIVAIRIVSAKFKINLPKIVEPPEEAEEDSDEVSSEDK